MVMMMRTIGWHTVLCIYCTVLHCCVLWCTEVYYTELCSTELALNSINFSTSITTLSTGGTLTSRPLRF
jgi:hypothetical protein